MAELLDEAADVARVWNEEAHSAGAHTQQETRGQCEDMIERQRGDDDQPVDLGRQVDQRLVPRFHLQHVGDQIAVGQHRAFGEAGGAAGILQEGDIVGPDRGAA